MPVKGLVFEGVVFRGIGPGRCTLDIGSSARMWGLGFFNCLFDGSGTRLIPAGQPVQLYYQVFSRRRGMSLRKQNLFWDRIFKRAEYGYRA